MEGRILKDSMAVIKSRIKRFDREREDFQEIPPREEVIHIPLRNSQPLAHKELLYWYQKELMIGEKSLTQPFNFRLISGDKLALVGANGVGKSTCLKALKEALNERDDIQLGYMPQNYQEVLPANKTAIEWLSSTGDREELTAVMTALASADFTEEEMYLPCRSLSGGQQAKLFLLQFSLQRANVLLLDEPTRNFSPLSQEELRTIFQDFPGTLVCVSHDRHFIEAVYQEVYELTAFGLELHTKVKDS